MKDALLIVEPWSCHFEVFPSVIQSAVNIYKNIIIYVQQPGLITHILDLKNISLIRGLQIKALPQIIDDLNYLIESNLYFDVWSNTTHVHRSNDSFEFFHNLYLSILRSNFKGSLFAVIHSDLDESFVRSVKYKARGGRVISIYLSKDTLYKHSDGSSCELFEPYTLNLSSSSCSNYAHQYTDGPLKLLIIGMCREGKKFSQLSNFNDLISKNYVQFSYSGWSPPNSFKPSGLFKAVQQGFITEVATSFTRLQDNVFNNMIAKAHAIIDLKMVENNFYLSSGNIGASVAMNIPLISHFRNYPSFNCLRYRDYSDLRKMLLDQERLREDLKFHRLLLNKELESRRIACCNLFSD